MTTAVQIPTRAEIPEADTWDLTHLYAIEDDYRRSLTELRDTYPMIAEFKGRLAESADTLVACLECDKRICLLYTSPSPRD